MIVDQLANPPLPPAVDEAIRLYNEAQDNGDTETVRTMRRSFADRINELEDFYLKHDDGELRIARANGRTLLTDPVCAPPDERAILFEKQRLRLRKLLHSAAAAEPTVSPAAPAATTSV